MGHDQLVNDARFSPDGTKIVTASNDETAKLWDVETGELIRTFERIWSPISSAKFNSDGTKIVIITVKGTVTIFNTATGQGLPTIYLIADQWGGSAKFSPDDSKVVVVAQNPFVLNAETVKIMHELKGHTSSVWSAEFSPDSTKIVTAAYDKTAKIWNAATGELMCSLEGHRKWIVNAQFSPDGTKILTVSIDQTAKIWDISQPWIQDYIHARKFTIKQILFLFALWGSYTENQPTFFSRIIGPRFSKKRLKDIFKTFDANTRKALTKRFNIQEEPPEEIFEAGLEQLGL